MRALAALTSALLACSAPQVPPSPTDTAAPRRAPASDCPGAPGVELRELSDAGLGSAFGAGGHIVSLALSRSEDDARGSLVGELDVKGTLALERRTRVLALENYASTQRGGPARQMAVELHGRVIARVEVSSALRGSRFRVPLLPADEGDAFTAETETELQAALRTDRRCFPGRSPRSPGYTGALMDATEAATLAETFLRAYVTEHHPVPPAGTSIDDDFATVVQRVEVDGERTLRAVFNIGMPFRMGDHRAPNRINACLQALLDAHPALLAYTVEVTADTFDPEDDATG